MSRPRMVDGVDERGRPKTRWADPEPLDAPRYGHMEPAYDATSIERRRATPDELARLDSPSPIAPVRIAPLGSLARIQQSRMNGARRHVEVMAARKAEEEQPMPDQVRTPPDGEEWSVFADIETAARAAAAARQELDAAIVARQVAAGAFDTAIAELEAVWDRLRTRATAEAGSTTVAQEIVNGTHIVTKTTHHYRSGTPAKRHKSSSTEDQEKAERARRVMDAIERHGGDRRAAAAELGMKVNAVSMVAKHAASRVHA